jgi:hypothetical protein
MKRLAFLVLLITALACNDENASDWNATLNLQPPRETPGGKLVVTGSMNYGDPNGNPSLVKRSPQGINPKILMLDVMPPTDLKGNKKVDLRYEEGLQMEDQHTSVEVYYKGEKIADMKVDKAQ